MSSPTPDVSPDTVSCVAARKAARSVRSSPMTLVLPRDCALAERHGMSSVFETARMHTKDAPAIAIDRVFGVTSFELG